MLEKRAAKDPQTQHLKNAFDDLLPFTGLWPGLEIGTFHRLLSLWCPQVTFPVPLSRRLLTTCAGNDQISDTDQNYMGLHTRGRRGASIVSGHSHLYNPGWTMSKSLSRGRTPASKNKLPPSLFHHLCTSSIVYPGARPED